MLTYISPHRFPVIAQYWSNYRLYKGMPLCKYPHNSYITENYNLWSTFLSHMVYGTNCNQFDVDVASFQMWRMQYSSLTQNTLRRLRSYKITNFSTNRKLKCDFLLVNNTNWRPVLHCRLLVIFCFQRGYLSLTTRMGLTLKLKDKKFGVKKVEILLYRMVG